MLLGPAQVLCDTLFTRGATWNRDGVILLEASNTDPLVRVPAAGGAPVPMTRFEEGENTHRWPQFLPDSKHFLFFVRSANPDSNGIYVDALDSPGHTLVLRNESAGFYVAPGYLLFVRDQTLMAQPFSLSKLATTGDAFPVAEHEAVNSENWLPIVNSRVAPISRSTFSATSRSSRVSRARYTSPMPPTPSVDLIS